MKIRLEKHYTTGRSRDQHWYVGLYTQPAKDHLIQKAYHWYDMRIPLRLPGWKSFERFLRWRGGEIRPEIMGEKPRDWKDRALSWSISQDFRCYELSKKNRKTLGQVEVGPGPWQSLKVK